VQSAKCSSCQQCRLFKSEGGRFTTYSSSSHSTYIGSLPGFSAAGGDPATVSSDASSRPEEVVPFVPAADLILPMLSSAAWGGKAASPFSGSGSNLAFSGMVDDMVDGVVAIIFSVETDLDRGER
jgi:hypothetical protein